MKDSAAIDVEKICQELSTSGFPHVRREAAIRLGQLSFSNDEIVQALVTAVELDNKPDVKSAALQALQAPVHQAFLKDHPDFIQKASESVAKRRTEEQRTDDEKYRSEYLRRRTRVRFYYLLFFCGMFLFYGLIPIMAIQNWLALWIIHAWQVVYLLFVAPIFYLIWRRWRCPACEAWLGGFSFSINALLPAESLHCPNCGTRLF